MICGGETLDDNLRLSVSASCWSLNPNGSWKQEGDMNVKRYGFSLTLFQNQTLYAIGGRNVDDSMENYWNWWTDLAAVEILHLNVTQPRHWIQLESAPFNISHHCAVALESSLWLIGGSIHYDKSLDEKAIRLNSIRNGVNIFYASNLIKHSLYN